MRIIPIIDNRTNHSECVGRFGLSIYIETLQKGRIVRILFDTGAFDELVFNAGKLKLNLEEIDFTVLSHGHYDHTGGVPVLLEKNPSVKIYVHKHAFRKSRYEYNGKLSCENIGIRWNIDELGEKKKNLIFTENEFKPEENILISGEIPRNKGFEMTETFFIEDDNHGYIKDDMRHEQFLAIKEDERVYLFVGCSHIGVMSQIEYAKKCFNQDVYMVIGGLHLLGSDEKTIYKVIEGLKKEGVRKIAPMHCSGLKAICKLETAFEEDCVLLEVGTEYEEK